MLLPRKATKARKRVILFLDTGDNCRCPMAAGYLKKLLEERGIRYIEIKTAGVMTATGLLPAPEVVQLLQEEGVDVRRHRSRPITAQMVEEADLILGMTPFHVQSASRRSEAARGKAFLLKEFVGYTGKAIQIGDPMGGTMEVFKKCFEQIKDALEKLVEMDVIRKPPEGWTEGEGVAPTQQAEEEEAQPAAGERSEHKAVARAHTPQPTGAAKESKPAEEPAAPRRRGRPPKKRPEAAESAPPEPPRRKRGRPPKRSKDLEPAITAGTTSAKASAVPAPRKRGRPRKTDSAAAITAKASSGTKVRSKAPAKAKSAAAERQQKVKAKAVTSKTAKGTSAADKKPTSKSRAKSKKHSH